MTDQTQPAHPGWKTHICLVLLLIVYVFNFVDRQILSILAQPIKAELNLSDAQLGWLGGFAFAFVYTLLGIPAAMIAQRVGRVRLITAALIVWSAATAACGLANSWITLALGRFGVGVGEAGGVAPSQSLISDLYPPAQRARAMAVFSLGVPLGSGLGIMFGGLLAATFDWRHAFVTIGLAGVVFAPLFFFGTRRHDGQTQTDTVPAVDRLRRLIRNRSLWLISLGASLSSVIGYGLMFWLPSVFMRSFKATLMSASFSFGLIVLIGGAVGILGGGFVADRLGAKSPRAFALVPAVAYLLCIPAYGLVLLMPGLAFDTAAGFALLILAQALGLVWMGPVIASLHHVVEPQDRALASALFLFVTNIIGLGFGSWTMGAISDYLSYNYAANALKMAVTGGLVFYALGAGCFLMTALTLKRDWKTAPISV
ncbi:spinster family MFS transporter [Asticcacaulis excentricus]|uniref:Major facilitator superfamily MFS_1 n=1 Tax=Asticcacaulis excentricus (strain ATCC 15261 / DSM 4724 / KCTC 12464 / NCIMB 9791 / VKM B-1370 / CB 48) TaxID=573065 RepID=E8RP88_ASTEC|nr:MFS transporter [Asticcacaulis excentricus]ADU11934.1 major facilitator superfamily MFS_1 [Asticcacaulis excentricus CB 48]